ncbi:hypothetical protein [Aquimarina rhabdastrellae]
MNKISSYALVISLTLGLFSCNKDDDTNDNSTTDTPDPQFEGVVDWVKTFGGSKEDNALSVVETTDNAYAVLGYTLSNDGDITDKTATDSDFWLLKLDTEGTILWSKTYGGTNDDRADKLIQTSDGGFAMVGYSRSNDGDSSNNEGLQDYWIVKTDANGTLQWQKSFGFAGIDRAYSVVQTTDGGYFISGFLDVTASGGDGNSFTKNNTRHGVGEFWGIKLDANGEQEWRRYFGGTNNDRSYDVLQTPDNGFLMIGSSESDDFDITNSKGSYDFWLVKVNAQGTLLWQKSYGGSEIDVAYAITATGDGKYIIVGDSRSNDGNITTANGNADLWMVQIDGNGNLLWEKSLGGSQFDTGRAIHKTPDGNFVITGNSRSNDIDLSNNLGQSDIWTMLIDANANVSWQHTLGGSQSDFGNGCIGTNDSKLVVVGTTESDDHDISNNKGERDVVIIKYK